MLQLFFSVSPEVMQTWKIHQYFLVTFTSYISHAACFTWRETFSSTLNVETTGIQSRRIHPEPSTSRYDAYSNPERVAFRRGEGKNKTHSTECQRHLIDIFNVLQTRENHLRAMWPDVLPSCDVYSLSWLHKPKWVAYGGFFISVQY